MRKIRSDLNKRSSLNIASHSRPSFCKGSSSPLSTNLISLQSHKKTKCLDMNNFALIVGFWVACILLALIGTCWYLHHRTWKKRLRDAARSRENETDQEQTTAEPEAQTYCK